MSVCVSLHPAFGCHTFEFPIPEVISQNITNKSCLVCVKSEKCAFWVILRLMRAMRRGKAELHKSKY